MKFYINNLVTIVPLLLIMMLLMLNPIAPIRKRRYFFFTVLFTVIESAMEAFDRFMISGGFYSSQLVTSIINVIGFLVGSTAIYFFMCLVIQDTKAEGNELIFALPLAVDAVLCVLSIWFPLIFHIDKDCNYSRGFLFEVHLVIVMLYFGATVICDVYKKRRYLHVEKVCVIVCFVLCAVAFFVQIIIPEYVITWNTIGIALIFYYIVFLSNAMKHDTLTGIFNRRLYDVALKAFDGNKSVTIVNIDVNGFKSINDGKGHKFGDQVLVRCAQTVQTYFAKYGFAYRVGGDEFCIICRNMKPVVVEAMFENIEIDLSDLRIQIGNTKLLSYGVCEYDPSKDESIYNVVSQADVAMYEYKSNLKNKA